MTNGFSRRLAAGLLALGVATAPAAADQPPKDVSRNPQLRLQAETLVVWVAAAIDQARKTRNVAVLHALLTPRLRRQVKPAALRKMLRQIKANDFSGLHADFKRFPKNIQYFRLKKIGKKVISVNLCNCPEGYHLYFDMRFRRIGRHWRIDAMKVWDVVD